MATCIVCNGTGKKSCPRCDGKKMLISGEVCLFCREDGKVTCSMCDGKGYQDDAKHREKEIKERAHRNSGDALHRAGHESMNHEKKGRI